MRHESTDFSTSPSLLQGELHFLPKPLFLRKRGCSWLCYSAARVLVSSAEPVPTRGCRCVPTQHSCDCLSASASSRFYQSAALTQTFLETLHHCICPFMKAFFHHLLLLFIKTRIGYLLLHKGLSRFLS